VEKFVARLAGQLDAMDACRENGDLEGLARLAHWLKGSAGTVGFDAFTEPAAELEALAKQGQGPEIEAALRELRGLAARIVVSDEAISQTTSPPAVEERRDAAASRAARPRPEPSSAPVAGPLVSRLESQHPRFWPTIEKFVGRLFERLDAMEASAETGDLEELARLAHWLKGAAGTVGFDAFNEPALNLELFAREGKRSEIEASIQELRGLADRIVVGSESDR
jgi:HPt (histidine-containing phosphotransfer) domain-containing protein